MHCTWQAFKLVQKFRLKLPKHLLLPLQLSGKTLSGRLNIRYILLVLKGYPIKMVIRLFMILITLLIVITKRIAPI